MIWGQTAYAIILKTDHEILNECVVDVVIDGPPIRANWYSIWSAAVAIVAMCAKAGQDGVATGIGMNY